MSYVIGPVVRASPGKSAFLGLVYWEKGGTVVLCSPDGYIIASVLVVEYECGPALVSFGYENSSSSIFLLTHFFPSATIWVRLLLGFGGFGPSILYVFHGGVW